MIEFLAVVLVIGVLVGAVCGMVAVVRFSQLQLQFQQLQQQLQHMQARLTAQQNTESSNATTHADLHTTSSSLDTASAHLISPTAYRILSEAPTKVETPTEVKTPSMAEAPLAAETNSSTEELSATSAHSSVTAQAEQDMQAEQSINTAKHTSFSGETSSERYATDSRDKADTVNSNWLSWLERQLIDRGMVWLGAIALAFGGVFLVRHSLDAGWFSPTLRIASGVLLGLLLLGVSEWLHQRKMLSQRLENYIPAALASAGFITMYAALLMAQNLYQLIHPLLTFGLLASVALTASWFSLRQGPILAVIGIIGAYAVPILVDTGSQNILGLVCYLGLITASSVWVERYVQRAWLWFLPMLAHCAWLTLLIIEAGASQVGVLWCALLLSFVGLVWLPRIQYGRHMQVAPVSMRLWWPPLREHSLGGVLLLLSLVLQVQSASPYHFYATLVLMVVLWMAALSDARSECWLWAAGLMALLWISMQHVVLISDTFTLFDGIVLRWQILLWLMIAASLLVSVRMPQRLPWSAFLAIAPVLVLALSYYQLPLASKPLLQLAWMFYAAILVIVQALLAKRAPLAVQAFIHGAGANLALSFSFTLYLSAANLTLALALQVVMLTLLAIKQRFPIPHWVLKALIAVILFRLTAAPILGSYETITFSGWHWSLWVYPVVLSCFMLATRLWRHTLLQPWLEGACLHLVAVFITVQSQYWLNDRSLDFRQITFQTLSVHSANWLLLAWVYHWRSELAGALQRLYRIVAAGLVGMALVVQAAVLLHYNPFFSHQAVGEWPVFNWILVLWGIPALLLIALARLKRPQLYHPWGYTIAAALGTLFVLGSVRQFWQGPIIAWNLTTSNAEHYSYSVVFLALATLFIVLAELRQWWPLRKAGFVLLSVVVFKVFVFDLNELTGLLRAASFIGLGASLVLLSALFQRLAKQVRPA